MLDECERSIVEEKSFHLSYGQANPPSFLFEKEMKCSMDRKQARRKLNLHSDLPQTQIERERKKVLEA